MNTIIQFVPRLPVGDDGIGDYALSLAHYFLQSRSLKTRFVAYDDSFQETFTIQTMEGIHVPDLVAEKEIDALLFESQHIIFHFNYIGSSKKVLKLYQLLKLIRRVSSLQIIVMFHELIVSTKISGDLKLFNPRICWATYQIARMADCIVTNNSWDQSQLRRWIGRNVFCIPVFSNIGEPTTIPDISQRKRRIVVFGGKTSRLRAYTRFSDQLLESCDHLGIDEVCDIGKPIGQQIPLPSNFKIREMGFQSSQLVSKMMLNSLAGFLDYSHCPRKLAKSGIYAAYCAHGTIPVTAINLSSESDGIYANEHYLVGGKKLSNLTDSSLQVISRKITQWYRSHNFSKTCDWFGNLLK